MDGYLYYIARKLVELAKVGSYKAKICVHGYGQLLHLEANAGESDVDVFKRLMAEQPGEFAEVLIRETSDLDAMLTDMEYENKDLQAELDAAREEIKSLEKVRGQLTGWLRESTEKKDEALATVNELRNKLEEERQAIRDARKKDFDEKLSRGDVSHMPYNPPLADNE